MEILREIRVRADDLSAVVGSESGFTMKAPGLMNELRGKNVFVKVRDVRMPSNIKSITLSMNYVKMRKQTGEANLSVELPIDGSDFDLLNVTVNYLSMQDLCLQLTQLANQLIKSSDCMSYGSDHSLHICENIGVKDLVKISYANERVVVRNGQGYVLVLSIEGAVICGLEKSGIELKSRNDIDGRRLEGQCIIGHPVSYFNDYDHVCHVLLDAVIPKMYCDEKNFGVLFTYNNKKCTIESDNGNILKKAICSSDNLRFYIIDDSLKPIVFERDLISSGLRFTLIFLCK